MEGGLKARSTRGAIGRSWWSKRFLTVLESFALGSRLTRGRAYARAGQVLSLRVAPGEVTATVQGSRRQPYQVRVGLAPFPDQVWEAVEVALAEQAIYSARLLAGEMPPDIEEVFEAAGAPLFPGRFADLSLSCSCPDPAVPCKHLAASFYLLAEAFDADPFQILHWRGRDRAQLLPRLRELRAGDTGAAGNGPGGETRSAGETGREASTGRPAGADGEASPVGAASALAEVPDPPLAESLDRLWPDRFWLPPVPLPDRPATLDTAPDLLLRQLPAPPAGLGGPALAERLREAYRRFAEADRLSDRRQ
ncbi:MAG TPA: hypothetical protein VKZ74_02730 [Natronosporangium sp.]|nr:hypothetical protein [Natronosporangium sp.]